LIVNAISESIKIDANKLSEAFGKLVERHVKGEIPHNQALRKEDKITEGKIEQEIHDKKEAKIRNQNVIQNDNNNHHDNAINKRTFKSKSKKKLEFKKRIVASKRRGRGGIGQQTTLDASEFSTKVSRG
jgi:hypothetical protein